MEPSEKTPETRGKTPLVTIVRYEALSPEQQRQVLDLKTAFPTSKVSFRRNLPKPRHGK
ncbi:MAG: hypothetical protein NT067_03960 [Candidatus Diapherotrites archaeon]|nr:hypothetical protein [Candidatus Diapherotrites archaeon]